jgi:uncharacterized RDD family membrane protein YckC
MESGTPGQQPPAQPPPGPQAPGPQAPPGGYQGQMPPGGWQYPVAPARPVWAGPPLASWGSRVGARLLDGLVVAVAVGLLFAPGVLALVADATVIGVVLIVLACFGYLAVYIFYGAYFTMRQGERNGQTLGKQWLGIRAVRDNGQSFDLGSGLLREFAVKELLFGVVGSFFMGIPWLVDALWPLWEDENRALHDLIVKTHVVRA